MLLIILTAMAAIAYAAIAAVFAGWIADGNRSMSSLGVSAVVLWPLVLPLMVFAYGVYLIWKLLAKALGPTLELLYKLGARIP